MAPARCSACRRTTSAISSSRPNTLPIRRVVSEGDKTDPEFHDAEAYTGPGTLVNSHFLDGMDVPTPSAR
jgi:hypothetical protein